MGGCAGKKKSKNSEQQSDLINKSELRTKDDRVQSKSSSFKNLSSSNGSTVKNDGHTANTEKNGSDANIQATIKQSDGINKAIGQIFSSRVISVSDSELEYELANLIYGNPENDYKENPLVVTTFKSTEV